MKPEERPGLGRKVVVTDAGIDSAVVDAIDRMPAKLVSSTCGAILQVPDEDDESVPEFVLGVEYDGACRNPR